ncbi:MAG: aspartate/glutamate racemase family protein [Gammaproteobacteria bacterium]|nr:aspartate/glutamate racemase family protein [Gammaproteobacteria bacterium]
MKKEKIIAIGGGVGPMAGVELHKKIIENTLTNGTDQDHLEVHHFSRSHDVADRTDYLLNKVFQNPAQGMFRTMQMAEQAARIGQRGIVAGVPCNTFHAPKIFQRLLELIQEHDIEIQILHMLEEVAGLIFQIQPQAKTVGLMSTTGTRTVHVYNDVLEPHGLKIVEVPQDVQPELHESIYNKAWGIKAVSPVTGKARGNFEKYANLLCERGAQAIILGCTEIPLALPEKIFNDIPLIDPMLALARALIREVDEEKLRVL